MKKSLFIVLGLCSVVVLSGCKSRESAFRQAYEKAKESEMASQNNNQQTVTVTQQNDEVEVTPVATTPVRQDVDKIETRTIKGGFSVIKGTPLKTFSVVVGSFVTETTAYDLADRLKGKGFDSRVVKTNEVINGKTPWFRVVASSFDDKVTAANSRDELRADYPGAWLLYNK